MAGSMRMANMHDLDRFMTGEHAAFQHPTQHNLSPVEGDTAKEHLDYADAHGAKARWHYQRAGRGNPVASFAKAGVHDFKAGVARNWPGDK